MIDAARKRSGVITNFRINLRIGGMRMFFLDFLLSADGGAYANLVSSHEMIVQQGIFIMNRKGDDPDDPYDLIRRLRATIEAHAQTIEQYKILCDALVAEKEAALTEAARLRRENDHLIKKIERGGGQRAATMDVMAKFKSTQLSLGFPGRDLSGSNMTTPINVASQILRKRDVQPRQFVPRELHFSKRQTRYAQNANDSSTEIAQENVGMSLIEDFIIISPDLLELRSRREAAPEQRELRIEHFTHFNFNKLYADKKKQYITDIAKRCFPIGALAWRQTVDNLDDLKRELQVGPQGLGEPLVISLKGDFSEPPGSERVFLGGCNPFRALFAVCLRVPDFIPIKDEKHYQRSQQEVWRVEKVYVVLTYYPFMHLHSAILSRAHSMLQPPYHALVLQDFLARNLVRNLADAQKDEALSRLAGYCMARQPELGQVWTHDKHYLGTLPTGGRSAEYALARYASGAFFSVLAYEEVMLLLAALFLEKTIIFVGRNEAAASLCALFLVSCIAPFTYSHHLILSCSAQMVENIVFGFPLPLVASLKKQTSHFPTVLASFIDNTVNHFRGFQGSEHSPLILVDIDSNCIFYDHELGKLLQNAAAQPSPNFREAYRNVNPAHPKSFSFPKKMPVELHSRPRNDFEKNAEQRKKLLRQYQQKIDNNTSKWPVLRSTPAHIRLLDQLTDYIHSFAIPQEALPQLFRISKQLRQQYALQVLNPLHPDKPKLLEAITKSQIFADYLDHLERTQSAFYRP